MHSNHSFAAVMIAVKMVFLIIIKQKSCSGLRMSPTALWVESHLLTTVCRPFVICTLAVLSPWETVLAISASGLFT